MKTVPSGSNRKWWGSVGGVDNNKKKNTYLLLLATSVLLCFRQPHNTGSQTPHPIQTLLSCYYPAWEQSRNCPERAGLMLAQAQGVCAFSPPGCTTQLSWRNLSVHVGLAVFRRPAKPTCALTVRTTTPPCCPRRMAQPSPALLLRHQLTHSGNEK